MHFYQVFGTRLVAIALFQHFILKAGFSSHHAVTLGIFRQELLAGFPVFGCGLFHFKLLLGLDFLLVFHHGCLNLIPGQAGLVFPGMGLAETFDELFQFQVRQVMLQPFSEYHPHAIADFLAVGFQRCLGDFRALGSGGAADKRAGNGKGDERFLHVQSCHENVWVARKGNCFIIVLPLTES